MDQHDDNPNGESRDVEIDTIRTGTQQAYTSAYRVSVETVAALGLEGPGGFGLDPDRAHRLVSLVLGAALLELEVPWRAALERAHRDRDGYALTVGLLENDLIETRRLRERWEQEAHRLSSLERDQASRADAAERDRERARDLAVRLEGELAEVLHAAGAVLDQAGTFEEDGRVHVRREPLDRLAALLVEIDGTPEETDR